VEEKRETEATEEVKSEETGETEEKHTTSAIGGISG